MTITPFLTLRLRGKRDAIIARQRARRVASLLNFDVCQQACIAAGTFVVACQALTVHGKAKLVFQIENQLLHVFAEDGKEETPPAVEPVSKRLAGLFPEANAKSLFRLAKPLPARELAAEELELGWLTNQVEAVASDSLFDEVVKQNQEVLALLHELRLYQRNPGEKEEKPANPHAA